MDLRPTFAWLQRLVPLACLLGISTTTAAPLSVVGGGSTLSEKLYSKAAFAYCFAQPDVSIAYTGLGSGRGLCRLESTKKCAATDTSAPAAVDFAGVDTPLKSADYLEFPDLQMYPAVASGVVPIYNLGAVTDLVFSTNILARIFRADIIHWDHTDILALNPNFTDWGIPLAQRIEVVVRSDSSGTTEMLKRSLKYFDPLFAKQVDISSAPTWGDANVSAWAGNQGVVSRVLTRRYTLGYTVLGEALDNELNVARLQKADGNVVEASVGSIEFAMLQGGLAFGNNGDDPSHLTEEIHANLGPTAWPIVGFTYVVTRKQTLREGATCGHAAATVAFWYWFWTSPTARSLVRQQNFAPLPDAMRDVVVRRLLADNQCDGKQAWHYQNMYPVSGRGPAAATTFIEATAEAYVIDAPNETLEFHPITCGEELDPNQALDTFTYVMTWAPSAPAVKGGVSLTLAAVGIVAVAMLNVTLDGPTLALILDGEITTWLDPRIAALNPDGLLGPDGRRLADATQAIRLLRGPAADAPALRRLLASYRPGFTGSALAASPSSSTENILRSAVIGDPYALTMTLLTGTWPSELMTVRFRRPDGHTVLPSWRTIQACATPEAFDAASGVYSFASSRDQGCYPLAEPLFISARASQCNPTTDPARTSAALFVSWMLVDPAITLALTTANMATLLGVPEVATRNTAALDVISCAPRPVSLWVIGGAAAGGGLALCFVVAGLMYAIARQGRRNNSAAPKDDSKPFCVVFTDIQSSTRLWAIIPVEMAAALETHHSLIRKLVKKHSLYEVKTIGDSFMCAVQDPNRALAFALDLQRQFYATDWGTAHLDTVYTEEACFSRSDLTALKESAWNGLRVRVGIHYGMGEAKLDPVTQGYDYYGTVVNTAARIESVCHGGQIGVSQEVYDHLNGRLAESVWTDLGRHTLRGLAEPLQLYQVLPAGTLADRVFPPLRLDKVAKPDLQDADNPDLVANDCRGSVAGTSLSGLNTAFQPDLHPLVLNGSITAPELQCLYTTAVATLSTLLAVQSAAMKSTILKAFCSRLHVHYGGTVGVQLQHTLHGLVMRALPAVALQEDRRGSMCLPSPKNAMPSPSHSVPNRADDQRCIVVDLDDRSHEGYGTSPRHGGTRARR